MLLVLLVAEIILYWQIRVPGYSSDCVQQLNMQSSRVLLKLWGLYFILCKMMQID